MGTKKKNLRNSEKQVCSKLIKEDFVKQWLENTLSKKDNEDTLGRHMDGLPCEQVFFFLFLSCVVHNLCDHTGQPTCEGSYLSRNKPIFFAVQEEVHIWVRPKKHLVE